MKLVRPALVIAIAATAVPAIASPDARSLGMGGTGVASAHGAAAAFHNPALLAQHEKERFSLILPAINVGLNDADDTLTGIQDVQDGSMDASILAFDNYQADPTALNGMALGQQVDRLNADLAALDNGSFELKAGVVPLAFAVLRDTTSYALHTNAAVRMEGVFDYDDQTQLAAYSGILTDGTVTNAEAHGNPSLFDQACVADEDLGTQEYFRCLFYPDETIQSTLGVVGLGVAEVGFSMARTFTIGGQDLQLGITPKYQQVRAYYYLQTLNADTESSQFTDYEKTYSTGNIDIGLAKSFVGTPWSMGVSIKNLVPQKFDTVVDEFGKSYSLEMNPQVTVGGQGHWQYATLTADLDLTQTDSLSGVGNDTQFLSVGGEFGWRLLNLRAGYRHNLANSDFKGGLTAGLGLGPLSLSAMATDNAANVVLQLSTTY